MFGAFVVTSATTPGEVDATDEAANRDSVVPGEVPVSISDAREVASASIEPFFVESKDGYMLSSCVAGVETNRDAIDND